MKDDENLKTCESQLLCSLEEKPPLPTTILLAFQHIVTAFGGIVAVPLVVGSALGLPRPRRCAP